MKGNSMPTANQAKVRVLVADDHPVVRHGIIANVKPQPDMIVVAEAGDGVEALALIKEALPDVVLLDLRMPRKDGLDVLAEMKTSRLACKVIIMTTFDSEEDVQRAMKAGARGYLLKEFHSRGDFRRDSARESWRNLSAGPHRAKSRGGYAQA